MKWLIGIVVVVGGSVAIELVFEEYSFLWLLPFWMTVSTLFVSLLVLGEIPRRDYLRWKEFRNKAFWDEVPFVYSWLTVMAFACLFGGKPGVLVGGVVGFFYSLRVFRDVFALRRRFEKAAITQKPSD